MRHRPADRKREHGVALVTTVIVVAVLAVVAVAMMQSTTVDRLSSRSVANYTRAKLAAHAGIADAMSRLSQTVTNFSYVSGSEASGTTYRTYVRPTTTSGGAWVFAGPPTFLDSGTNGDLATLFVSGSSTNNGVTVRVAWTNLQVTNSRTNRYAFWVDEAGAKQNLSWWAGTNTPRGLLTNIANLPLMLPSANGQTVSAMPADAGNALSTNRSYQRTNRSIFGQNLFVVSVSNSLLSPATFNLLDPALQGNASSYFFTLSSPSSAASPAGRKKLNLQHLAYYLNTGISSAQGANSPKANLVTQLLTPNPSDQTNWGGGDLSWLASAGKYSTNEQRQIVANLVDYLDDDLIPTTDSLDAPTYFGVEMKADSSGRIIGHPFINFVAPAMIFNRSTTGEVNSSRLICSLGLVFPWNSTNVSASAYTPEINIAVEGSVLNGIPAIGPQAGPYFRTNDFGGAELNNRPITTFTPFTGNNWPEAVGLAGSASYSHDGSGFYGFTSVPRGWPSRAPANMTLQNARYVIKKMRLRYTGANGISGYVQVLPTNTTVDVVPRSLVAGGGGGPLLVKFSSGGAYANTANLYLAADPRASFRTNAWTNLPSLTAFGTSIPRPLAGAAAVNLTNGTSPDWDKIQGLNMNFNWFTNRAVTNHLSRASAAFQSIGELGYLWTGKPWQTLSMTATNNPATADWNLLDYVSGGYTLGANGIFTNYTAVPLVVPSQSGGGINASNSLLQDGAFNVLSRKRSSVAAYLEGAPGILTTGLGVDNFVAQPPPSTPSIGGALSAMTNLSANTTTKFGAEAAVRALANGAANQSRIFTIYSRGESVSGNSSSSVTLEADVFVDVNPQTGAPRLRLLSTKEL